MTSRLAWIPALLLSASLLPTSGTASAFVPADCTPSESGYSCVWGPISIQSGQHAAMVNDVVSPIPEPGYITSGRATLVDAQGAPVSRHDAHLHHVVFLNPNRSDTTCPSWPERFFASGKERTALTLPEGYGYFWDHEPPPQFPSAPPVWAMALHVHTMHHDFEGDVYVKADFGFEATAQGSKTDVTPMWFDVRNCSDDSEYDIPKGDRRHRATWKYTMPVGGRFVAMAGHVHDRGLKIRLKDLSRDEDRGIFTSRARYEFRPDEWWYLTKMTSYSSTTRQRGVVASGDELRLISVYNDRKRINGAMGIMIGFLDEF